MTDQNINMHRIDRRTFVEGAGLAAAAITATGTAFAAEPPQGAPGPDAAPMDAEEPAAIGTPEHRWQSQAAADWRVAPDPVAEELVVDGGTYDVVIVGGGQSGTWCARSATMNGLKVAVVEAMAADEFLYVGGEVGHLNSEWALAHGTEHVDEVEFLNEVFRRNAGRSNQSFIKDFAYKSGKYLDWAIEDLGDPDFMEDIANVHVFSQDRGEGMVMDPSGFKYWCSTVMFRPADAGLSDWCWGPKMMTHQREAAIDGGATWLFGHRGYYLEKDGDGRVCAVVAHNTADDTYVRLTAGVAVVLAAGDFSGNADMVRDINDEYRHIAESYGDIETAIAMGMFNVRDGDGIKLGVWAGGHVEVGPRAGMNTGQVSVTGPWGPGFLTLNKNGKRFCDECAGGAEGAGYMIPRQPRGAIVNITDANWLSVTERMPPCHAAIDLSHGILNGIDTRVAAMAAVQPGDAPNADANVYCADTLEELLDLVGVYDEEQKATALAQIERFNEFARAGRDEDFGMDARIMQAIETPPFYAAVGQSDRIGTGLCQTTGLDVDSDHCVLDSMLEPIPGLYAIGNNAGNRYIVQYATPIAGMSLGFCLTEGMGLGEQLAGIED